MTETLEQLIQQLRSPDAVQRRQAIMALANLRDPAALQPLAHIYRNDPDAELRDLALKAGRYLRQIADAAQASTGPSAGASTGVSTGASAGAGTGTGAGTAAPLPNTAPTERDIDIAKTYMNEAVNLLLVDDKPRTIEYLGKALALNPGLADETFTQNMIMTATGMAPAQAVPILIHPDRREQLILQMGGRRSAARAQGQYGDEMENVTWNRVLIDLGVYWVANAISSIVLLIFLLDMIETMMNAMGYGMFMPNLDLIFTASLPRLALASLLNSFSSTFFTIIFLVVIHFTAVTLFDGDADMEVMFRKIVPLMTIFTAASTVALVIFLLIGSVTSVWFLIPLVLGGGGLLFVVYIADTLGKVYNFGFVSGCISVIIGAFIYLSVEGCISYMLGMGA